MVMQGDDEGKKLEKCSDYVTVPIYSHTSIRKWYKKTKRCYYSKIEGAYKF